MQQASQHGVDGRITSGSSARYLILAALALSLPSAALVQRAAGMVGALAYIACVFAVVFALPRLLPPVLRRLTAAHAIVLGMCAWLAMAIAFAVIYPRVNTHQPGAGSDRDDALNVGVAEIVHGRYPYHARTYLDAPVSPGPGALLQSVPFWMLGNASYQNFFWLIATAVAAGALLRDVRLGVLTVLTTIVLSPALVGHEVMVGGDYFCNSLYVLTGAILVLLAAERGSMLPVTLAAAVLGFLLSSRANYPFVVPLLLAYVWRRAGARPAIVAAIALAATLLAVSLPFYLYDPQRFGPLAAQNKFGGFAHVLPHPDRVAAATLMLLTLAFTAWIFRKRPAPGWPAVMAGCAAVLLYPALFGLVLDCIGQRRLEFAFAGWGASACIFATLALFGRLRQGSALDPM